MLYLLSEIEVYFPLQSKKQLRGRHLKKNSMRVKVEAVAHQNSFCSTEKVGRESVAD